MEIFDPEKPYDESCYWLELCIDAKWNVEKKAKPLLKEANEITAIIVYLIKKAKGRL